MQPPRTLLWQYSLPQFLATWPLWTPSSDNIQANEIVPLSWVLDTVCHMDWRGPHLWKYFLSEILTFLAILKRILHLPSNMLRFQVSSFCSLLCLNWGKGDYYLFKRGKSEEEEEVKGMFLNTRTILKGFLHSLFVGNTPSLFRRLFISYQNLLVQFISSYKARGP